MRVLAKKIALVAALLVISAVALGKSAASKPVKARAVAKSGAKSGAKTAIAVVIADEAQIYSKPDLDAPVIAQVKQGTKLTVSTGTRGDYAKFHRTRVGGKLGWILILDVRSEAVAKKVLTMAKAQAYKPGPFASENKDSESDGESESGKSKSREPFLFTRSISFAIGMNEYKEAVNGYDYSDHLLTYGLKLTGPDVLLTGPLMDVNIVAHYGAPIYYNGLSSIKPSGFIVWTDANFLLPIVARDHALVGVGAGPLLVISNIQTTQVDRTNSIWQFNLGVNLEVTAGFRWDDLCLRIDAKYLFENKTYGHVQFSAGTV